MKLINKFSIFIIFITLLLSACTGSILEEELLSSLSETGKGGIELDEYIPPGIQFVETTTQGMQQEGFPYLKNNRTFNIKWVIKTCDPINDPATPICGAAGSAENPDPGFYITQLYYSPDNGANYIAIPGAVDLGGYNDQIQSFSWSIPLSLTTEGDKFKFKLITRNAQAKEYFATSSIFVMDNSPPTITANTLKFNGSLESPLVLQSPGISIDFSASDSYSPVDAYCLKDTSAPPSTTNSCWILLSSIGLTPGKAVSITNLKRVLGWIGGSYSYYFWVKDKAGNISQLTDDVGDETIDFRSISYSPGRAVVFTKALSSNSDTSSENPASSGTVIKAATPSVFVKWNYTLDPNTQLDMARPYNLEYSTDGTTFKSIVDSDGATITDTTISAGVDNGCSTIPSSEPNSHQKCFVWAPPPSTYTSPIYIRIHIRDSAGFVYSVSPNPLNLSPSVVNPNHGLRVVAGLSDTMIGASALSTKFNIAQDLQNHRFVVHEDGRIFVLDSTFGVVVISPYDGKSQIYIKRGNGVDGWAYDNPSLKIAGEVEGSTTNLLKISLDYKGRLLIMENNKIRMVTDFFDAQNNLTGRRKIETIVGCITAPCYYDNTVKSTALNAKVPKQYWPNAWINANEFNFPAPNDSWHTYNRHFTPLPNGDIYFTINTHYNTPSTQIPSAANSYRGLDWRIYRPDPDPTKPGKLYPLKLTGNGVLGEPFRPISEMSPNGPGGLTFNYKTGLPTTLNQFWEVCTPQNVCDFFTSNHNPKTGTSNGTGTHYFSLIQSIYTPAGIPKRNWTNYHVKYITSRRGELYAINSHIYTKSLSKLNTATNKFVKILGGSYDGYCPDGTLALNCNTNVLDAWISQDNTVFFVDGYQIRMIGTDGRIVTLFGRRISDRTGADAMLSTMSNFENFAKWTPSDGSPERIIIKEPQMNLLREVPLQGNFKQLAGNNTTFWNMSWKPSVSKPGYFVTTQLANTDMGYWGTIRYINPPLVVNPTNGEVFNVTPDSLHIAKLLRPENTSNADRGRWLRLLGGGTSATPIAGNGKGPGTCDGKMNNQCRHDYNGSVHIAGYIPEKSLSPDNLGNPRPPRPGQLVTIFNRSNSTFWEKYYMKLINWDSGLQTHFAGNNDQIPVVNGINYNMYFPDSFTPVAFAPKNNIPFAYSITGTVYDPTKDALIVGMRGLTRIGVIGFKTDTNEQIIEAGDYYNLTNTTNAVAAFTHFARNGTDVLYYCSTSGRLYKRTVTPSSSSEIQLVLPAGFSCNTVSRNLEKTVDENLGIVRLYVALIVNGQFVLGEYNDPLD